jgi:hypothetical protein
MNYDKRWASWSESLDNSVRLSDSNRLVCKTVQKFKHLPISMTDYYSKNWSGWGNDFEQALK